MVDLVGEVAVGGTGEVELRPLVFFPSIFLLAFAAAAAAADLAAWLFCRFAASFSFKLLLSKIGTPPPFFGFETFGVSKMLVNLSLLFALWISDAGVGMLLLK